MKRFFGLTFLVFQSVLTSLWADATPQLIQQVQGVLTQGVHVSSFEMDGEKVWAKRTERAKTKKSNCMKYYLSQLIPYRVLRPTFYCADHAAIDKEVSRIQTLENLGVRVPHVLASHEDWIVISDMGQGLEQVVGNLNVKDRTSLLKQAAQELGHLHALGQWHGRAHIKDFTYQEGKIGFIDFEEDPSNHLTITECQARDILIFSFSILSFVDNDTQALKDILMAYREKAPPAAWDQLLTTAKDLSPLLALVQPIANIAGRDIKRAVATKLAFDEILHDPTL